MFCFRFAPEFLPRTRYTALAYCVVRRHLVVIKVVPYLRRRASDRGSCGGVGTDRSEYAAGGSEGIDVKRNLPAPPSLVERRQNVREAEQPVDSIPGTRPHRARACVYVCVSTRECLRHFPPYQRRSSKGRQTADNNVNTSRY